MRYARVHSVGRPIRDRTRRHVQVIVDLADWNVENTSTVRLQTSNGLQWVGIIRVEQLWDVESRGVVVESMIEISVQGSLEDIEGIELVAINHISIHVVIALGIVLV